MLASIWPTVRSRSGRGLIIWFALTILAPGVLLTIFGVRSLVQERRFADQQVRDRLDRAAGIAVDDLERELRDWDAALDRIARSGSVDSDALPRRLRAAVDEPGAGVVTFLDGAHRAVWPPRQLLYSLEEDDVPSLSPSTRLGAAEMLEVREKDYTAAIAAYQRLLTVSRPGDRAELLHRLARTYRRAGRDTDAAHIYADMIGSTDRIGRLPAELVARYEICSLLAVQHNAERLADAALALYADMVRGRWRIDRTRYRFYTASLRGWLAGTPRLHAEIARWSDVEERKHALTEAVAAGADAVMGLRSSPDAAYIVFLRSAPRSVALVVAREWLAAHVWPETFAAGGDAAFDVTLLGPDNSVLFTTAQPATRQPSQTLAVTRGPDNVAMPWRVRVSARDPGALAAALVRRQTFYIATLVLVLLLLGFGTFVTTMAVKKELEVARLQSNFVSTVSHEFRSPLTGIRQLGELLMRGRVTTEERRQQYYERITRESDRLSRLVENLLDLARMEDGRKPYHFARLEPSPWLRAVVDEAQSHVGESKAIIATIPDALPSVVADHEALGCALHNLIDNAVKYSPDSDAVWIEADADSHHVTIRVRDRGVGISSHDRTRVFDKFYRSSDSITREVKGAGLGLSLVQHIVTAHGGRVECDSRPGEGTTFSIRLESHGSHPGC
jgi:signal transduction histidine kinase